MHHLKKDRGFAHPLSSEITSRQIHERRRDLLKLMAVGGGGMAMATWAARNAFAHTIARAGQHRRRVAGVAAAPCGQEARRPTDPLGSSQAVLCPRK
ncbi:MAG TPA: hypothetical protein VE029_10290 [Rhizobacter sp.]|nr:hypothetical protein [Rhizobacter sp.]